MHGGEDAEIPVGQADQEGIVLQHCARRPGLGRHEEHHDGEEGSGRDQQVHRQRCEHAAIVQEGEGHDGEHHERALVDGARDAEIGHERFDQIPGHDGVRDLEHRVGHHKVEADIEGRERPDDVLGLRVLAARGGHRGGNLGIDHGHAGVEYPGEPAGGQRRDRPPLPDGEVPTHELAHQHDPDAERPNMAGPEHAQERDLPGGHSGRY